MARINIYINIVLSEEHTLPMTAACLLIIKKGLEIQGQAISGP